MIFNGFWLAIFLLWQRQHIHHHRLITGFTKITRKTLSLPQSLHHQSKELTFVSEAVTLWGFLRLCFWYYYGPYYYLDKYLFETILLRIKIIPAITIIYTWIYLLEETLVHNDQ